ncbi:MAG TPA: RNA-binding protein [Alloiococcus sp.]|nr:RNA-binding protein [Alloiococcus sp.]
MSNLYQHFRDSEKDFIDMAIDWVRRVENQYTPYLSSFLNPREQYILKTIVGQYNDIQVQYNGGYERAERQRAFIYPSYYEVGDSDFELSVIEIRYPKKFSTLTHGSIMGSFLGCGLTRDKLGDIINEDDRWQFFVDQTMTDFLKLQLDKIGRTKVNLLEIDEQDIINPEEDWIEATEIISSLRLDVFIASCLNLGRDKAQKLILNNRVKLNWTEIDKVNINIEENDMVSIRGFGRIKYDSTISRSKKNKYVVKVFKLLH